MALTSYSHSAHYTYLDRALRTYWLLLRNLEDEIAAFVPKPIEEFADARKKEIQRLQVLNPDQSVEQLTSFVDKQFEVLASADWQFIRAFDDRHMTLYVTVVILAHALSEALINAVLAIGLANAGSAELFPLIEKAEFKQKWLVGPKAFAPNYTFPEGTAIHETLITIARQRNALVHQKIDLTIEGKKVLEGSGFKRAQFTVEQRWLRRFFSLPYDLSEFVDDIIEGRRLMLLSDRHPIEVASEHTSGQSDGSA